MLRTALVLVTVLVLGAAAAAEGRRTPIVVAVEKAAPAVVNISTERTVVRRPFSGFGFRSEIERWFRQQFPDRTQRSLGSGAIIDPDGFVVTNHHVVASAEKIVVTVLEKGGKERKYEARLINSDPSNDLALLKIDGERPFPYLEIAAVDDLMIAETVIAVGNPIGLGHTVTVGVLSAKGRSLAMSPTARFEDLLQTDASINPGNSGGPLLDVDGRLVGVNTAIVRYVRGQSIQGIGFAIPAGRVRSVLDELIDYEKIGRLWLGFEPRPGPAGRPAVLVSDVADGGPAKKAGLRTDDLIVAVDGRPVRSLFDFKKRILRRSKGDALDVTIQRGEEKKKASLVVAEVPIPEPVRLAWDRLGAVVSLQLVRLPRSSGWGLGVGVLGVKRDGPTHRVGLQRGDVLAELAGVRLDRMEELVKLLREAPEGAKVEVKVWRATAGRMTGQVELN